MKAETNITGRTRVTRRRGLLAIGFATATIVAVFTAGTANAAARSGNVIVTPHDRSATASSLHAPAITAAATCYYSTDRTQGFLFDGIFWEGYGYAGHYSGLTAVPSRSSVTEAGIEAQCLLARTGRYNPGSIDGIFGPNSRAAMRALQTDMNNLFHAGLSVDGLPGPDSWKWLRWWTQ